MTRSEIEALVRHIIGERGLPFAVVSVMSSPIGWNIRVRAGTRGIIAFTVRALAAPLSMRTAIERHLERESRA